ncbi:MAG: SUF system Fe-S cluster assembly regulator [Zetaproteobacteria bacterium]|nr:MAG: SUF system Fe-S cluster assembly regulator [Zetaproteobacteria bacterium]
MLRLTRLTDYGILLMTHMPRPGGALVSSQELAEATRVPATTVSKLLQSLLAAGLLESVRGAHGGYRLARAPEEISVCDIIDCFEGHLALTECNLEDGQCDQSPVCSTIGSWKKINRAVREALASISLADMTRADFTPVFQLQSAPAPSILEVRHEHA